MVYLKSYIEELKKRILVDESLPCVAYSFLADTSSLPAMSVNLSGEEAVAAKGYKGLNVEESELDLLILKKPYKGFDYSENVYKLVGMYLAAGDRIRDKVEQKFKTSSAKNRYFIAKCLPELAKHWHEYPYDESEAPETVLVKVLRGSMVDNESETSALHSFVSKANDVIDLLILEDLEKHYISKCVVKEVYLNKDSKQLVMDALENFEEAIRKITSVRRKDHSSFEVNDEYDVQDLLYVILKTIFPKLKEEDPTPRVGAKSNKIDLILREEGILIEVKMIKRSDSDDKPFVEQLKNDIQSYYECKWLKHLICLVYDPFKKTKSKQNFYDLNGIQTIKEVTFTIDVVVT